MSHCQKLAKLTNQSCLKKRRLISVADTLSRVTLVDPEDHINLLSIAVNMITTQLVMSLPEESFQHF